MTLDDIVGQAVPVSILRNALNTNTLGHAYLFSGAEGLGKETVARAVAHELAKQGGPLSEIHVLDGDASLGIDEVRALRSEAALAPAGYSIWIILQVERMSVAASNALLKTLEEPPRGTYFFLTTTQVHSLLPTILSRCQHLPFRRVAEEDLCQWLANRTNLSRDDVKIRAIAKMAQGSLGKAWTYWQGSAFEERTALVNKLMEVPRSSYPQLLGLSQTWPEDRQKVGSELQLFLQWHRDLLVVKNGLDLPLYNASYRLELEEISNFYSQQDLIMIMEKIVETGKAIAGNGRIRFYINYLLLLMKKGALT